MHKSYDDELKFEKDLITALQRWGWSPDVLRYKTEDELIQNWADILYRNNSGRDKLDKYPLTRSEMDQILQQVRTLRSPLRLNGFINGKTVTIKRDNPDDIAHLGKEVTLKIYDRSEVAGGDSCYQIAEQPRFTCRKDAYPERRGDLMLLINGMPLIHIELKKSSIPLSQATNQIEKYSKEGVFTGGFFSLIQVFVAMTPEETVYFANPGPDGQFKPEFFFHWEDFNNEIQNEWEVIAEKLLSIPMAHQLIGFYTVADDTDGVLKVMRSYQYYAASQISNRVAKIDWNSNRNQRGGYIWHTTGSGKTLTSFKSAQLISDSGKADKVIFLIDRIELGNQSLSEYQGFAASKEDVQGTEDTKVLIAKLKSTDPKNTLIVTSIQKMSKIQMENGVNNRDIEIIGSKRMVFIVDECHRDTFGEMMSTIKETFPKAVFFGFTGTPIQEENKKKGSTTADVFGDELHRYVITDGIRDHNVLGFDPYMVQTFPERAIRTAVGLDQAKAKTVSDIYGDKEKGKVFYYFLSHLNMAGKKDENGNYVKGIEDYLPITQYDEPYKLFEPEGKHRRTVMKDISENWQVTSHDSLFHAIFATSSIREAILYYRLFKKYAPSIKATALFNPGTQDDSDFADNVIFKEDGLHEVMNDYSDRYGMDYRKPTDYQDFRKDIAQRLAHKKVYKGIEKEKEKQLDLLIVVDQMLTGFDSKWVNTLYLDKILENERIIQAFSRTNRIFGNEKRFGIIKYYRKPFTMRRNVEDAIRLYSGNKPMAVYVSKLWQNIKDINDLFDQIKHIFAEGGHPDFDKLPADVSLKQKFALLFRLLSNTIEAGKVQGLTWQKSDYEDVDEEGQKTVLHLNIDEKTYEILLLRYKELFGRKDNPDGKDLPFDIDPTLIETKTGEIDAEYMNSRFKKYLKAIQDQKDVSSALDELHKTFATLTEEDQRYANMFIQDIEAGNVEVDPGKSFRAYIEEYKEAGRNTQIHKLAVGLGLDEKKLSDFMAIKVTEQNINEYGRYDALKGTIDKAKAKKFLENREGITIPGYKVLMKADELLRSFVLKGGFHID